VWVGVVSGRKRGLARIPSIGSPAIKLRRPGWGTLAGPAPRHGPLRPRVIAGLPSGWDTRVEKGEHMAIFKWKRRLPRLLVHTRENVVASWVCIEVPVTVVQLRLSTR
jgi:hypothetical protein